MNELPYEALEGILNRISVGDLVLIWKVAPQFRGLLRDIAIKRLATLAPACKLDIPFGDSWLLMYVRFVEYYRRTQERCRVEFFLDNRAHNNIRVFLRRNKAALSKRVNITLHIGADGDYGEYDKPTMLYSGKRIVCARFMLSTLRRILSQPVVGAACNPGPAYTVWL